MEILLGYGGYMKNKNNKKTKLELKRIFTKQELLKLRKYKRLMAYDIPYDVINRAYNRYLKNINFERFIYVDSNRYPQWWFGKDRDTFCNAVKLYIECKKANYPTFKYKTIGDTKMAIVKLSGLNKLL
jgi:hypothetical protein